MTLISTAELINGLDLLHSKIVWIKCPFCDDEVTKLRPCGYWRDNGQQVQSSVCVECAETVKGLTFMAGFYPIPGVDVSVDTPEYISKIGLMGLERSNIAKVFYGAMVFRVEPKGPRLSVLRQGGSPDQEKTYDNTHQVWFALKNEFEKGDEIEKETKQVKKGSWAV